MMYARERGLRPSFFNRSKGISLVVAWTLPLTLLHQAKACPLRSAKLLYLIPIFLGVFLHFIIGADITNDGIPLYKWNGEQVISRTKEEIAAERAAMPAPPPSPLEQIRADIDFIAALQGVSL